MAGRNNERGSRSVSARLAGGLLRQQTFAAFELRNFRLLWLNNFSYALVQGIQRFAFVWLAADLSEKNLVLGLVTFGLGIPVFFLTLPAGVLSDRWDRRYLLFASQLWVLATSFLTAVLIWTGAMGVGMAIVMAILVGVGVAVGQPVRQALVPAVVPQHRLMNAITLNSLGQNVSQIVGPLLG
ncbi:MAG: MFS transporter, partial [Dehalococcoidia bacterium]|nr:MFS transporter [Dehalococcoidia bacterium]